MASKKKENESIERQEQRKNDEHPYEATDHVAVVNPKRPEDMTSSEIKRLQNDIRLGQTRLEREYSLEDVGFRYLRQINSESPFERLEIKIFEVEYKTFGIVWRVVGDDLASTEVLDKLDEIMKGSPYQKFFLVQIDEVNGNPRSYMLFQSGINWMTCISEDAGIQIEMRNARKRVHNRIIVNGSQPSEWPADKFEFESKIQAIQMCLAIAYCA